MELALFFMAVVIAVFSDVMGREVDETTGESKETEGNAFRRWVWQRLVGLMCILLVLACFKWQADHHFPGIFVPAFPRVFFQLVLAVLLGLLTGKLLLNRLKVMAGMTKTV